MMGLDVELKITVESHTHAGKKMKAGDTFTCSPAKAQVFIARGWAEKVGVVETEAPPEPEPEPVEDEVEESEDELPEEGDEDDDI